jgi:hypothetical protein
MRPYITVSRIPNFDPTRLPFWEIYVREGRAEEIQAGGYMGAKFTPGLSGGQRKMLLFELIAQRTAHQEDLLICLDEPFAGVTDDFVPYIVKRLNEMREKHNILLVTNDHVETLKQLSDNTITVSAIDRTTVTLNQHGTVQRTKAIYALSVGENYVYSSTGGDLMFFYEIEVKNNGTIKGVLTFSMITFTLYLITFWNSKRESAALLLVAGGIITYFSANPYLLTLVGWRDAMLEESEALLHSSKGMNKVLKCLLTFSIVFTLTLLEYGVVNAVTDGFGKFKYWFAMFFDIGSLVFPHICLGIFTRIPFQFVQLLAGMPFLMMIFFSTTFSPGAGIPVLKELRYLWPRFYFWCMVDEIAPSMEGCPKSPTTEIALFFSAQLTIYIFLLYKLKLSFKREKQERKRTNLKASMMDEQFHQLQVELYGDRILKDYNTQGMSSTHSKPIEEKSPLTLLNGDHIDDIHDNEGMADTLVDGHTISPPLPPVTFTLSKRSRSIDSLDSQLTMGSTHTRTLVVGLMEV